MTIEKSLERITFDGDWDHLDEIVASGVDVHLEMLDTHTAMLILRRDDGLHLHLHVRDPRFYESENEGLLGVTIGAPLMVWCPVEWESKDGRRHRCDVEKKPHTHHRCECGSRSTKETP